MKVIPLAVLTTFLAIAGCCKSPATTPEASIAAAPVSVDFVDSLEVNVVADGVRFQPDAAKVVGSAIVSTGAAGFLMFGPYVAFAPGKYRVTIQGSISSPPSAGEIRFDSVSHGATVTHGSFVVSIGAPLSGTIAEFDIAIAEGVTDLEVRAGATAGANVRIESYQISKVN